MKLLKNFPKFSCSTCKIPLYFKSLSHLDFILGEGAWEGSSYIFSKCLASCPQITTEWYIFPPTDLKCQHYHAPNPHMHLGLFLGFLFFSSICLSSPLVWMYHSKAPQITEACSLPTCHFLTFLFEWTRVHLFWEEVCSHRIVVTHSVPGHWQIIFTWSKQVSPASQPFFWESNLSFILRRHLHSGEGEELCVRTEHSCSLLTGDKDFLPIKHLLACVRTNQQALSPLNFLSLKKLNIK